MRQTQYMYSENIVMDNIYVSDVYVNVRMFRKFIGVCDVTIDHANNSVRVLSVLQRFFFFIYVQ